MTPTIIRRASLASAFTATLLAGCGETPAQHDGGQTGRLEPNHDAGNGGTGEGGTTQGFTTGGRSNPTTGSGLSDAEASCAKLDARPQPKASAVWFVFNPLTLDGRLVSDSNDSERTNRDMFRDLLFSQDGVVPQLGDVIEFGMASHAVPNDGFPLLGECPQGFLLAAKRNHAAALADAYQNDIPSGGGTTWASMEAISGAIASQDEPTHNTIILVRSVIDDQTCDFSSGPDLQRQAISGLVSRGATVSVVTLLLAPGQASDADARNKTARASGASLAELGNGDAFASNEEQAIREAVEASVADAVSCEITLQGKVEDAKECQGEVLLGGAPVPCNDPDGFRLLDASTLELTGAACERLRSDASATLSARFPCDVFVLI